VAEPPAIRASDAEREQTVERLREACADGRITFEELAERIELAYAARTTGELEAVAADLPAAPAAAKAERDDKEWAVAIMGGAERRGRWRPAARTVAVAVMGGVELDLREATIEHPEVEIEAVAVMGGVDITVPEHVDVQLNGFALMGGNDAPRDSGAIPSGAPVVRVKAYSVMGGVSVKRKPPGEDLRQRLEAVKSAWMEGHRLHGTHHRELSPEWRWPGGHRRPG
jgi:hypothetical protein